MESSSLREGKGHVSRFAPHIHICRHSPLQKVSADVRFPDLGIGGKNAEILSDFIVSLTSSDGSDETNDNLKTLSILALKFCRGEYTVETVVSTDHRDLPELLLRTSCTCESSLQIILHLQIFSTYNVHLYGYPHNSIGNFCRDVDSHTLTNPL